MGIESFQFGEMFETTKQIVADVFLYPFKLLAKTPDPIMTGIFLIIGALGILILFAAIMLRNKWQKVYR